MRAVRPRPDRPTDRPMPRARALLLALAALLALPAALPADPAEQRGADARQKLFVRRAFNDDAGLAPYSSDVWIEVRGTVVVLSGQVPSAMLKQRALFLAKQVKGIAEVKGDGLQVVPREGVSDLPSPFAEGAAPAGRLAGNRLDGHTTEVPKKADLPEPEPARAPLNEAVTLLPPVPLKGPAVEMLPPRPLPAGSDLPAAVEALRRQDERFGRLTVEVRRTTVYLRGTVARWADVNDLTNVVRRLPGVGAVVVDDVKVDPTRPRGR
jgi:osmotically-inducible protein OsmY